MAKWLLKNIKADFYDIARKHNIDPAIARILVNRGLVTDKDFEMYLNTDISRMHDPLLLKDMDKLIAVLTEKLNSEKHVRIIGDYDIDGVCSTAILKKGMDYYCKVNNLKAIVDTVIPHRINDGYGLNINIIENASSDGVDTIITCDNGISAVNEIKRARELGMTVLITDHHEIPFEIIGDKKKYIYPEAVAIVDPKRPDGDYPFPEICGGFVAYKVIQMLLQDQKDAEELLDELFELAAFATIGDIMELKDENRVLVKNGLRKMSRSKNTGLNCLIDVTEIDRDKLSAYHIGFILGPCINATGRLDSADRALELLLSDNKQQAMTIAAELKDLNESRKVITEKAVERAEEIIENENMMADDVMVIYVPDIHESVAGIVAGRLKEKYTRPCLVITDSEGVLKGSARSIEAYHIYNEMSKVSSLFLKYGGHSQAAGFSLEKSNLEALRKGLNDNSELTEEDFNETIRIDMEMPLSYCSPTIMKQIEILEPTGMGNESVRFGRLGLKIIGAKFFGQNQKVGRYTVEDKDGQRSELTLFNKNAMLKQELIDKYGEDTVENAFSGRGGIPVSVVYHPSWNEYRGVKSVQLILDDYHL